MRKPIHLAAAFALLAVPAAADTRVLAYGDSNTWGWVPIAEGFPAERLDDTDRWGGVLNAALGEDATVVVDGMVGRRTDIDGIENGLVDGADFNGAATLPEIIARNMPLDLVVIMLGTNDLQAGVERAPGEVAAAAVGMAHVVTGSEMPIFSAYPAPKVLIVAPPAYGDTSTTDLGGLFGAGEVPSRELGAAFVKAGATADVPVFDAALVVTSVGVDGIHMDVEGHRALGEALAPVVQNLLEDGQ